ncbi:MAG: DNA mismatch repair protein MutS, partial [Anaerolineae bacterium]|nr:DNA mismatch repair protein MutS [Anaerolineae bacterium]
IFDRLNAVFRYLETRRYPHSARLRDLCAPFTNRDHRPSTQLRYIGWLVSAASIRGNPILWFALNIFVPWDYTVAYLFQRRKAQVAVQLPRWLNTWFELEALCSLANFAYLNPDYHFPTLAQEPLFSAKAVGHPLIPYERKVCNDFALADRGSVVIITGSNMAGKSSFLRTVGVNLALAYAGAPVNAASLETGPFRLFTCIKVSDSVTDGFSYFYAEVRRLKALLDALDQDHPYPLFFLIDEIFKGTNNRERLSGSFSYIRALVGRNCLGIVSTHDLELIHLADEIESVRNQHFREEVINGRMEFDYKLRSGPSPTTNALKIMQLEGLPVEAL